LKTTYYIFFLIYLFVCETLYSQAQTGLYNIVPNPDFELYDTCPDNASQLNKCIGWYSPTLSTPDYFNNCCELASIVSIPSNHAGFQYPNSGNGYAGIFAYWNGVEPCDYREYIQARLNQPLEKDKSYYLEFYVSLSKGYSDALKKIGALFTTFPISRNDECPFFASPQVVNTSGYLTDTLNWMKISGTFKADGGEEYITIGDFESTTNDDLLIILPDSITFGSHVIYYYIDGISFTDAVSNIEIPNVFTPNNDGINDFFEFKCTSIANFNLIIYNRWGCIVYETNDVFKYWNGEDKNGNKNPDGVYYYIVSAKGSDNKEFNVKGTIQLLR
jgi:gliding motility-associated-like protein